MSTWRMACPKCNSLNIDLEEDQRAFLGGGRHQVQLHCYTCGKIIYGEKPIADEAERQRVQWEKTQAEREAKDAEEARKKAESPQRRPLPEDPRRRIFDPRRRPAAGLSPAEPRRRGVDEERLAKVGAGRKVEPVAAPAAPPAPVVVEPVVEAPPPAPLVAEPVPEPIVAVAPVEPEPSPEPAAPAAPAAPTVSLERVADDGSLEAFDEETNRRVALGLCAWSDCEKQARPNSKYCSRNCSNKNARARHSRRRKTDGEGEGAEAPPAE